MDSILKQYDINEEIYNEVINAETGLQEAFKMLDEIAFHNQLKVLKAMQDSKLQSTDFFSPTGYGYGDIGREKIETIYSKIFHTEDALVRPAIASGTHAIYLVLDSLLNHGDELIFGGGLPYDTMVKATGLTGHEIGTLKEKGVNIKVADLKADNSFDFEKLSDMINEHTKVVALQRSTGYSLRRAFSVSEIGEVIKHIKSINPNVIVFVDNCYGEFTEMLEPSDVGADVTAGSLIKNPGGGIAISGGYIVGNSQIVERCANRLTAPGIGKEVGLSFNTTRLTLQGLYLAPHVTKEAMKGAYLVQKIFSDRGYECIPAIGEPRSDIVQTIVFRDKERLVNYAISMQEAGAVDSFARPTAWDMPGYEDRVVMASGSFIDGSSIELSADAPIREPYAAYHQGGLTFEQSKLAVMIALRNISDIK